MSHPLPDAAEATIRPAPAGDLGPRVLGDIGDAAAGPTLILVGGIHGNEPAGVEAIRGLFARLDRDRCPLTGRLLGVVGNRAALAAGQRFLSEDLNRIWRPARLDAVRSSMEGLRTEELELAELDEVLRDAVDAARGPACLLDLHTTSGPGPAFSVLHDTLSNRRFALALPVPITLGLEEELNGTLTDHMTEMGVVALSLEAGQHEEAKAVDRARAAFWIALDVAKLLPERYRSELQAARDFLDAEERGLPQAIEVRYRYAIPAEGGYRTDPGYRSFQPVEAGDIIGRQDGQPVATPISGLLLMPLYQPQGEDGFFVARRVRPVWLRLSTLLRRWRLERILTWLPGVQPVDGRPGTLLVNRMVARWLALQLFHLLGYRRREHSDSHLLMERRVEPERRA